MFAYCNNSPVSNYDPNGYYAHAYNDKLPGLGIAEGIVDAGSGGGGFVPGCGGESGKDALRKVIQNELDYRNNTNIENVFNAEYYAFYQGALVIRHSSSFLTSWSFGGVIFLNHNLDNKSLVDKTQALDHELGHYLHEKEIGTGKYLLVVAIPSVVTNLISRYDIDVHNNYNNLPWEYIADLRGGVNRTHASWAPYAAEWYFAIWEVLP